MNGDFYIVRLVTNETATTVVVNDNDKVVEVCKNIDGIGDDEIDQIREDLIKHEPSVWNRGRYIINMGKYSFIEVTELDVLDMAIVFEKKE